MVDGGATRVPGIPRPRQTLTELRGWRLTERLGRWTATRPGTKLEEQEAAVSSTLWGGTAVAGPAVGRDAAEPGRAAGAGGPLKSRFEVLNCVLKRQ